MTKNHKTLVAQLSQLESDIERLEREALEETWLDSADLKTAFNFSESKLYRLRKTR